MKSNFSEPDMHSSLRKLHTTKNIFTKSILKDSWKKANFPSNSTAIVKHIVSSRKKVELAEGTGSLVRDKKRC